MKNKRHWTLEMHFVLCTISTLVKTFQQSPMYTEIGIWVYLNSHYNLKIVECKSPNDIWKKWKIMKKKAQMSILIWHRNWRENHIIFSLLKFFQHMTYWHYRYLRLNFPTVSIEIFSLIPIIFRKKKKKKPWKMGRKSIYGKMK